MRARLAGAVAAVTLLVAACSGDDDADDADATTVPTDPPATTVPETTVAPTTPPTEPTVPATTDPVDPTTPTTVVDLEALKADIAEDYVASYRARREITLNPTLENLEARAATIAAEGSPDYNGLVALIQDLVAKGERVIPGDPPIDENTVEVVEISDPSEDVAMVTTCRVFNWTRVGPDGIPVGDSGVLTAARTTQQVQRGDAGWLPASQTTVREAAEGVTECPQP
jgi:hypothetical protein